MLDLAYFLQRFKNQETAEAAYASYMVRGEGWAASRAVKQTAPASQARDPLLMWATRWKAALTLRRAGLSYDAIGKRLGMQGRHRGERAREFCERALEIERVERRRGAPRATGGPRWKAGETR